MYTLSEWNYAESAQITWDVHKTWRCFLKMLCYVMKLIFVNLIDFEEKIVTQWGEYQDQVAKCSTPLSKWILWQHIPASPIDHQPPSQATHCSGFSFQIIKERNWFSRFRLENIFQQNPKFLVGMIFVIIRIRKFQM